jgi:hypothetical protein
VAAGVLTMPRELLICHFAQFVEPI